MARRGGCEGLPAGVGPTSRPRRPRNPRGPAGRGCARRPTPPAAREQFDLPGVALQQHFGNAHRAAEVPVDLKHPARLASWVGVEQVRRGTPLEQSRHGIVPPVSPRPALPPEVDRPAETPADVVAVAELDLVGNLAAAEAIRQRLAHGLGQGGRRAGRDLPPRMHGVQV